MNQEVLPGLGEQKFMCSVRDWTCESWVNALDGVHDVQFCLTARSEFVRRAKYGS